MSKTSGFCSIYTLLWLAATLVVASCGKPLEYELTTVLNPYGIAPLGAQIDVTADRPCSATIIVNGDIPFEQAFDTVATKFSIPVVGLYPGRANDVTVILEYDGRQVETSVEIVTDPLPAGMPDIEINTIDRSRMEPGMHLCDFHLANNGTFHSYPFIFDDNGDVRWYLDLSFFDDILWPIQRLKTDRLLLVGKNIIYEYDMLGKELQKYVLEEKVRLHHEALELPGGQLLIPIRHDDARILIEGQYYASYNDMLILFDPAKNQVTHMWDFAKHLDVSRGNINFMTQSDWLHMNALAFDPRDSSIIMSAKNQGVVKITWDDELVWILAPKLNWGRSGRFDDGFDTRPYLLTAVNSSGEPYPDSVQLGYKSADEFDFPWGQHAPEFLPNGNLIMYDNGFARNYTLPKRYSRAVEYEIDEQNMTVKQVWQYGKERGSEFFSILISDVDYLTNTGNILVTSGHIASNSKIAEVTYPGKEVVFEATLSLKSLNGTKAFEWGQLDVLYRSERFELRY